MIYGDWDLLYNIGVLTLAIPIFLQGIPSVVRHKSLYFDCHSGLDPESSLSDLDSRLRGNDNLAWKYIIFQLLVSKVELC